MNSHFAFSASVLHIPCMCKRREVNSKKADADRVEEKKEECEQGKELTKSKREGKGREILKKDTYR